MAWFHRTVFLGNDLALFLPDPNWKWAVEILHRLDVEIEEGRTGRENREPVHEEIRMELAATFTLDGDVAAECEAALLGLGAAFVGVPCFPDVRSAANWGGRVYDAEYVINYDATGYQIYAKADVPAVPARAWLAPLIVGRLQAKPRKKVLRQSTAQFSIRLMERSPWDFRTRPRALAVGGDWPAALVPNVRELPEDWIEDIIEYTDVGKGRVEAVAGEEGAPRRAQSLMLTLANETEIRTLLNFFFGRGGSRQSFTVPWIFKPGADTPETPHETKARFSSGEIVLQYTHGACATCKLGVVQVPWEIEGVEGETPAQPGRAYLYRFSLDVPGGPLVWRLTDWERQLTKDGDGVYSPAPIEHDAITQTIDLTDDATRITSWIVEANPVIGYLQRKLDVPMQIEIFECDPAAPNAAILAYSGEVATVASAGRRVTAETAVLGGSLEIKVPNFYFGPICNYEFCGAGCTLAPEDWTFSGTSQGQAGNELAVLVTANPPGAALADDYFARGWVKKGEGEEYEVRQIVRSEDMGGGVQKLTLKRPFRTLGAAEPLTFRPYCTGTRAECEEKYDNYDNFGGHPHVGAQNISLPKMDVTAATGKK